MHLAPLAPLPAGSVAAALTDIDAEITATLGAVADSQLDRAAEELLRARRVFLLGAGRSGLALQMTAMRLMHLGLTAHVVCDATAPAIESGDLLLVASGSGTTPGIVHAAQTASEVGASVVAITADAASALALASTVAVVVPAARKLDRDSAASTQYAGSLFEQSVVVVGDALFHAMWKASGLSADDLWPRHSNLE
ncbi:6-phospho-3-hexuloisomerase [Conyzicola nivalis]|uniref:6-phospho-3-hexuloisomerase n=1 Tax=Conyzicola nivalis TaxID=1477021 RepID=A0ABV2QQS6_9MICO